MKSHWVRQAVLFFLATVPVYAGPHYPLKASANGRYLIDQSNVPFLVLGDSPQSMLANLTPTEMKSYLEDRKALGFNSILVMLLCGDYTGGLPSGAAKDGTRPFLKGSDENSYDFSSPNPAYFRQVDEFLKLANSAGILVILNPLDTGLTTLKDKSITGWLIAARANGPSKVFEFGAYLGKRYRDFPNIVWHHGNDFQEWRSNSVDNDLVKQLMAGIASTDPNHLQTIELDFNFSYSSQDAILRPYLGMNAAYSYGGVYDEVYQAYQSTPPMPVFLTEGNYEYDNNTKGISPWPGGPPPHAPSNTYTQIVRLQAWWTLTSGGVGELYGNHFVWPFGGAQGSANWRKHLDSPGARQIHYIRRFSDAISWWELSPDQSHQVVTAGYGEYDATGLNMLSNTYVTTSWNPDGTLAVIYDPAGKSLTVDLSRFQSEVRAEWYDPTNGEYKGIGRKPLANRGSRVFKTPGKNHDRKPDWVLLLQATRSNSPQR